MRLFKLLVCLLTVGSVSSAVHAQLQPNTNNPASNSMALPQAQTVGNIEPVMLFYGPMPSGVAVSETGRIFVNFPRWFDPVEFTVAEITNGQAVPFPNPEINRPNDDNPSQSFVCVQTVAIDPLDRLWVLDTGRPRFQPASPGGPKLVGINLRDNRIFQTIVFPRDVALPTTYLNDIRFDMRRGRAGMAFITDSSLTSPNGIIVVDLASGRSWRRLNDHPSTKAVKDFMPSVEGLALRMRLTGGPSLPITMGADGIAISADGERLFYSPLASRRLYSVSVDALVDENRSDQEVAETVEDHGEKGGASDGLETDSENRVYLTNYEQNAIQRRSSDGKVETLVHDPRILWPDTLDLASDGYLYITANQFHRQPIFHEGKDLRQKPYTLFRMRVDASPVRLWQPPLSAQPGSNKP